MNCPDGIEWLTALISGGSAVLGGVVVAISNSWVRRADRQDAQAGELRATVTDFLAVTDLIGLELARQPQPGRSVRTINRLVRRLPQIDYTSGRLHERIFTPHLRALLERFSAASSRLALIAPEPMLEIIDDLAGLMAQAEQMPAIGTSAGTRHAAAS